MKKSIINLMICTIIMSASGAVMSSTDQMFDSTNSKDWGSTPENVRSALKDIKVMSGSSAKDMMSKNWLNELKRSPSTYNLNKNDVDWIDGMIKASSSQQNWNPKTKVNIIKQKEIVNEKIKDAEIAKSNSINKPLVNLEPQKSLSNSNSNSNVNENNKFLSSKKIEDDKVRNDKLIADRKVAAEKAENDRLLAVRKIEEDKARNDKLIADRKVAAEKAENDRLLAVRKIEEDKARNDKLIADRKVAAEKAENDRLLAVRKIEEDKARNDKLIADRKVAAEKAENDRLLAVRKIEEDKARNDKLIADKKVAAEKAENDRLIAVKKSEDIKKKENIKNLNEEINKLNMELSFVNEIINIEKMNKNIYNENIDDLSAVNKIQNIISNDDNYIGNKNVVEELINIVRETDVNIKNSIKEIDNVNVNVIKDEPILDKNNIINDVNKKEESEVLIKENDEKLNNNNNNNNIIIEEKTDKIINIKDKKSILSETWKSISYVIISGFSLVTFLFMGIFGFKKRDEEE